MQDDERDPLWEFLGKAREPKVPPFFSAKVLQAIRTPEPEPQGFFAWLRRRWLLPVGFATAAAAVALTLNFLPGTQPAAAPHIAVHTTGLDEMAAAVAENSEFEIIADLDSLLAAEKNSLWLEADPSSLY